MSKNTSTRCNIDSRVADQYISTMPTGLAQLFIERREFEESQRGHDMSVFRYRNEGHPFCAGGWVNDEKVSEKPVKKSNKRRQVESENE